MDIDATVSQLGDLYRKQGRRGQDYVALLEDFLTHLLEKDDDEFAITAIRKLLINEKAQFYPEEIKGWHFISERWQHRLLG